MFALILESLGTSELILIGIIALIFLGPRKLPEIARKLGKIMADFRNTTAEFKETWEREVSFEEEAKALRSLGDDPEPEAAFAAAEPPGLVPAPEVKNLDASAFADTGETLDEPFVEPAGEAAASAATEPADSAALEKKNWV